MIVGQRMTWHKHIEYVREKCKQTLNLMRCISNQNWGADKTTLMMIYRAFIRSRLDYGSIALNSATQSVKKTLDNIQIAALKISCGAMRSTANSAIQVGLW